ncbi:hypothetical protein HS088_TW03G01079 [Tripterygium wilfordii]|uniref:Uncharacterized protein n=1 Tax=Tripterygium wilfordii TaxID=458696 RepID=A0A7J7DWI6_TRIWF|nr:uncharacterized protein LOC119995160 [Tripterygium wilfordii]KAF5750740.1 hypothetical protein HS088_TW03G01079 [Tripterygium wilfordii]
MQAEKQQQPPWKIKVHGKAKNYRFRFEAERVVPAWMFHRFSILVRLRNFILKVKSEYGTSTPVQERKTFRSKFSRAAKKLRSGGTDREKKTCAPIPNKVLDFQNSENEIPVNRFTRFAGKEPISICSAVVAVGVLAFLSQSIPEKIKGNYYPWLTQ